MNIEKFTKLVTHLNTKFKNFNITINYQEVRKMFEIIDHKGGRRKVSESEFLLLEPSIQQMINTKEHNEQVKNLIKEIQKKYTTIQITTHKSENKIIVLDFQYKDLNFPIYVRDFNEIIQAFNQINLILKHTIEKNILEKLQNLTKNLLKNQKKILKI